MNDRKTTGAEQLRGWISQAAKAILDDIELVGVEISFCDDPQDSGYGMYNVFAVDRWGNVWAVVLLDGEERYGMEKAELKELYEAALVIARFFARAVGKGE